MIDPNIQTAISRLANLTDVDTLRNAYRNLRYTLENVGKSKSVFPLLSDLEFDCNIPFSRIMRYMELLFKADKTNDLAIWRSMLANLTGIIQTHNYLFREGEAE